MILSIKIKSWLILNQITNMTIFEKIINKEVHAYILYEDEEVIAILDHAQQTKGHTLVMPKKHFVNILDTPSDIFLKVMKVAQELSLHIKDKLQANGINLLTNANEVSGQSVMHFHVHILPRYDEHDTITISGPGHPEIDKQAVLNQLIVK